MKSSFFIKSLIMSDLKSNKISTGDNKTFRISTSEKRSYKPFRINTSKNTPGEEGEGCPRPDRPHSRRNRFFDPFRRHGTALAVPPRAAASGVSTPEGFRIEGSEEYDHARGTIA